MTNYNQLFECLEKALKSAKAQGITRKQIAKKSGVSTVAVHYWLTGKCPANVQNIIKVINACGYSVKFKMVKL